MQDRRKFKEVKVRGTALDSLNKAILKELPEIEGVEWRSNISQNCQAVDSFHFSVCASFSLEIMGTKDFGRIGEKLHQITSGGQIKIELEKY